MTLRKLCGATCADMVAVASSESFGSEEVRRLAWRLEGSGVAIALVPALTDVAGPRIHVRPVAGLPLMYVEEPDSRDRNWSPRPWSTWSVPASAC